MARKTKEENEMTENVESNDQSEKYTLRKERNAMYCCSILSKPREIQQKLL